MASTVTASATALRLDCVNDVAMQGNGSYASHSALQHEAMLQALPLLKRAAEMASKTSGPLTVVEYGSAHGNNSIEPLEAILSVAEASQVSILLSDRPQNDFNTLASIVGPWTEARQTGPSLFVGMMPLSFYRPVVPARSVSVGFSLSCLHHLERLPDTPESIPAQARHDLGLFLRLRAAETVADGCLVLSLVGRASSYESLSGPTRALVRAAADMVDAGLVPASVLAAFRVPVHQRTVSDVSTALDDVKDEWEALELREEAVFHPAHAEFQRRRDRGDQEASRWYADTIMDWFMAVCAGYWLKAIRIGCPKGACIADELLVELTRRSKEVFLRHFRDEATVCCYIHVLLRRLY
ncbi:fusarin C cluster-methyltransferase [Ophiocordyceps camponoti-floridani]|uniref:Fusarin C cluster-methyltransferase n=1 Tax=Ophiocordyceps camponoti-floridani TaxID=2030778 RepID=A0A8H4QE00_9HYPO|nr:fusarin C cluster-methyltransferase [Ophiocordyceps camponoti-floridani]